MVVKQVYRGIYISLTMCYGIEIDMSTLTSSYKIKSVIHRISGPFVVIMNWNVRISRGSLWSPVVYTIRCVTKVSQDISMRFVLIIFIMIWYQWMSPIFFLFTWIHQNLNPERAVIANTKNRYTMKQGYISCGWKLYIVHIIKVCDNYLQPTVILLHSFYLTYSTMPSVTWIVHRCVCLQHEHVFHEAVNEFLAISNAFAHIWGSLRWLSARQHRQSIRNGDTTTVLH